MSVIGENIKHYRTLKGFTQSQLANAIKKSSGFISMLELGKTTAADETIKQIADVLDVEFNDLTKETSIKGIIRTLTDWNEISNFSECETISIGWKNYQIVKGEPKDKEIEEKILGDINLDKSKIYLNATNTKAEDIATLINKSLYGLDEMYSIGLNGELIEKLSKVISYTLIQNNIKFTKED